MIVPRLANVLMCNVTPGTNHNHVIARLDFWPRLIKVFMSDVARHIVQKVSMTRK